MKSFSYDSCADSNTCSEISDKYAKDNLNSSNKFKHTFKKHQDGTYLMMQRDFRKKYFEI